MVFQHISVLLKKRIFSTVGGMVRINQWKMTWKNKGRAIIFELQKLKGYNKMNQHFCRVMEFFAFFWKKDFLMVGGKRSILDFVTLNST